jgi:hypothetical protein
MILAEGRFGRIDGVESGRLPAADPAGVRDAWLAGDVA